MAFPSNMTPYLALAAKLPQKKIAQLISVLLLIYVAYVFAKITWLLVPQPAMTQPVSATGLSNTALANTNKSFNIAELQALNLFGIYNEQDKKKDTVVEVQDAPETKLKLVLSGLVASDSVETAAAIIEYQGKQETYGIGDLIKGTRASLEKVLMDRVLIKQSGRLETLMLDGFDFKNPARAIEQTASTTKKANRPSPKKSEVVDQRNNKQLSASAKDLRADLAKDPGKITDYLRIQPKRKQGKIIGYALRPGKKAEFFKASGLMPGDVAVQMNGFDLTAASEAAQALAEMKQARDVSILVDRNGSLTEILFSID